MSRKHVLRIETDSEGEVYFKGTYLPLCKDEVVVRLGTETGVDYNEYYITEADYKRCQDYLKKKRA